MVDGERRERLSRFLSGALRQFPGDVDLETGPDADDPGDSGDGIPDVLYHGTAPRNRASIEREGLRPMARQEVHLSPTWVETRDVGRRHIDGDEQPLVFEVDAAGLTDRGIDVRRRGPETFLDRRVGRLVRESLPLLAEGLAQ